MSNTNDLITERGKTYGPALENHEGIAQRWTTTLRRAGVLAPGASVTWREVVLGMLDVKISRQAYCPKEDNLKDIEGYVAVYRLCEDAEAEREDLIDDEELNAALAAPRPGWGKCPSLPDKCHEEGCYNEAHPVDIVTETAPLVGPPADHVTCATVGCAWTSEIITLCEFGGLFYCPACFDKQREDIPF